MILAIDQGTTGTTCIAFDEHGRPVGRAYREFPTGTWSEQDVRAMWRQAARYEPSMWEDERESLLAGWSRALERARSNEADRSG